MKRNIKSQFPIFKNQSKIDKPFVYLDSAATTQKPKFVIDAIQDWYEKYNANIHRGMYPLAEEATVKYEHVRKKVADFLKVRETRSIIFTKGTTDGINLVASSWASHNLKKGDVILLTEMEHHSNMVPWLLLAKSKGYRIRYWPLDVNGRLEMRNIDSYFKGVKLFAFTHVSNVLGTVNQIQRLIAHAHKKGVTVLVDAAQSAGHMPIDIATLHPDFLVFSSHKMYGPSGVGVLYVDPHRYPEMSPYQGGGDMIHSVSFDHVTFNQEPWKFEAGTPPLGSVYGLGAAVDFLKTQGMKEIHQHERQLMSSCYAQLEKISNITILGPKPDYRSGLISFFHQDIHAHDLAQMLARYGICVRAGHHCAQPLHDKLGVMASLRVSFGLYNTKQDLDLFINALKQSIMLWKKIFQK